MSRALWLLPLALAAMRAEAQPLPAEVTRFYEDWNSVVTSTTLDQRRDFWDSPGQGDGPTAQAIARIRERWVQPRTSMPIQGYSGFPIWSLRLEVRTFRWGGPDEITLTLHAWPTALIIPARSPSTAEPVGAGARLGLTHHWRKQDGGWSVEQALEVMI